MTVPTVMIYTMRSPEEAAQANHYPEILGANERFLKMLFGHSEHLCSFNAYQFKDYDRYDIMPGVEEARRQYRDEQLPRDLESSYEFGKRLVRLAQESASEGNG